MKALADNPVSLKEYLSNYSAKFSKDLDELWKEKDKDGNGWLDKEEGRLFLAAVAECIDQERKVLYDPNKFDEYFKKYDTDGDNFLSKSEMVVFIKKVFNKKNTPVAVPEKTKEEKLKAIAENPVTLKEYLKNYSAKFD